MKNFSTAINLILLMLIGVLFFLYFSLKKSSSSSDNQMPDAKGMSIMNKGKAVRIAHVNVDSLNVKYQCMVDTKRDMESRENSIQMEFANKNKVLQDEYLAYQQKVQSNNISQVDAEKAQKDLQEKKDELDNLQRKHDDLLKEAQDRENVILAIVQKYVANYNKKTHFDYILAYAKTGSNILFANDSLDITKEVVAGLNKEYTDSLQRMSAKPH